MYENEVSAKLNEVPVRKIVVISHGQQSIHSDQSLKTMVKVSLLL